MLNLVHCSLSVLSVAGAMFAQSAGEPVREVGVGLGKIPGGGMMMTISPSIGGPMNGKLERKVPAGSSLVMMDGQGRVVSQAAINPADGSFQFSSLRVPVQENFSACLQSPGAAPLCSEPGALRPLTARESATPRPTERSTKLGPGVRTPVSQAAPLSAADAAVLANVQIAKGADGVWKCTGIGGKDCSSGEVQVFTTTVTKSRSNIKNNMVVILPDGTVRCTSAADGKPCSDTTILGIVNQMKAITKGGQSGF